MMNTTADGGSLRAERLIYGAAFFSLSSEVLMGLALPLLAVERGLAPDTLGLLLAVAAAGPIFLALPAGALCDHFGDRRVLIAMASGIALTALFYPFVTGLAWLFLLQLIAGICRSNGWVAAQSYMVRQAPPQERQKWAGKFTFSVNVGLLVAPLVGGALYTAWGAVAAFGFMAFWGICYALFAFLLPESSTPRQSADSVLQICAKSYRAALPLFLRPMIVIMLVLTLVRLMSGSIDTSFYPVFLHEVGFAAATIGILMTIVNGGATLGSLMAAPAAKKFGLLGALIGSIAISVVTIAVTPFFATIWMIGMLGIAHGLSLGVSMPLLLEGLTQSSAPNERGLALALRSMFNRGGVMTAPVVLGFLVGGWGMLWGFLLTGGLILLFLALVVVALQFIDQEEWRTE